MDLVGPGVLRYRFRVVHTTRSFQERLHRTDGSGRQALTYHGMLLIIRFTFS